MKKDLYVEEKTRDVMRSLTTLRAEGKELAGVTNQEEEKLKMALNDAYMAGGYQQVKAVYIIGISTLAILAVIAAVAGLALVLTGQPGTIPDSLIALGSAAVGAIVGIFAPSPNGNS